MSEELLKLFEVEVEKRVNEKITTFAKQVAESYKLPISLLLRDAASITPISEPDRKSETSCLGVKNNGQRCKFKAREGGYCNHHQTQRKKLTPIKVMSSSALCHTHSVPPLYQEGCPACECRPRMTPSSSQASINTPSKSVIDFNLLVGS
tara:strand:- start:8018 stop:8467 length:450 start_codon:yes stop_codon:yes gene_type:complete